MRKERVLMKMVLVALLILVVGATFGHPINDYYKKHKNDKGMESRIVPPKMASLMIDEDYPEAIDILKSLTSLKYLNYRGDQAKVATYAEQAIKAKGLYRNLLDEQERDRKIKVFGSKKRGEVRKLMVVVQTNSEFLLLIGKGRLSKKQIALLPDLADEI